jgi:hypothetical protein
VSLRTVIAHFSVGVSLVKCQTRATPEKAEHERVRTEARRIKVFIRKEKEIEVG